jgi:hypothetical protein
MQKLMTIILAALLVSCLAVSAFAVPRLQTYIVGAEYGSTDIDPATWQTHNSSFDLKVAGYWSPVTDNRPSYDWMGVGLIIGVPRNEAGSVWINGVEITSFYNLPRGLRGAGFASQTQMKYAKFRLRGLGFIDNNQVGAWHYDRGSIHSPGWGDEILLDVAVEGFSWSNFGALGIDRHGHTFITPGSHDAGFYRPGSGYATPEPGTLSLLGLGLLGLTPFLKKKKKRS